MICSAKFVKTHPDAILPRRNIENFGGTGDVGYDVFSVEDVIIPAKSSAIINIGLKVGYITPGYWFKVETRSGLGFKKGLMCHGGIFDPQYRGDCSIKIYNLSNVDVEIKKGDKIAQFVFYPLVNVIVDEIEQEDVEQTQRGEKGFGSSDELVYNIKEHD